MSEVHAGRRARARSLLTLCAAALAALGACSRSAPGDVAGGTSGSNQVPGASGATGQGGGGPAAGDGTGSAGSGSADADGGDGGAVDGGTACVGSCPAQGPEFTAACAALVPCFGDALEVRFDTGTHGYCYGATSRPEGQVDLGLFEAVPGITHRFELYGPDGTAQNATVGSLLQRGPDIDPWFHWSAIGYQGIVYNPENTPSPIRFRSWDGSGNFIADTAGLVPGTSAPDGLGGSVVVADLEGGGGTVLVRVDQNGGVIAETVLDDRPDLVLVQWGSGHVLVVKAGATGRARWYDVGAGPLTGWFDASAPFDATNSFLHGLLDGTIALSDGQNWRFAFRDGVEQADPPPAWLVARPGTRLANLPGGKGYAVLPQPAGAAVGGFQIQSLVEVLDPAGNGCGALELPPLPAAPAGATRNAIRLDVGQDGTLFELSALSGPTEVLGMGGHCVFRWWRSFFR